MHLRPRSLGITSNHWPLEDVVAIIYYTQMNLGYWYLGHVHLNCIGMNAREPLHQLVSISLSTECHQTPEQILTQLYNASWPQIAKTLRSTSIRYRSDMKMSVRCLIDVDLMVFAIWESLSQWNEGSEGPSTNISLKWSSCHFKMSVPIMKGYFRIPFSHWANFHSKESKNFAKTVWITS